MSSNSNSSSSSPPRVPPHIRLNSGQEDLLNSDANSSSRTLVPTSSRPSRSHLHNVYTTDQVQDSAERLLPPSQGRSNRFRDDGSPMRSPARSSYSSRRSSWESDRSRDSRGFENPFRDSSQSRPGSRAGSEEDVNTQTVSEKYNILPSAGLLLFPEDVEKDDYLHNPDPNDKERDCDIFTKRGFINVGGLALLTLGILALFVGYPVLYVSPPFSDVFCSLLTLFALGPLLKRLYSNPTPVLGMMPASATRKCLSCKTCALG